MSAVGKLFRGTDEAHSDEPKLALIVGFAHGEVNEIPIGSGTTVTLRNAGGALITTFTLDGVTNLVLTEEMDWLDNTFALAPTAERLHA